MKKKKTKAISFKMLCNNIEQVKQRDIALTQEIARQLVIQSTTKYPIFLGQESDCKTITTTPKKLV